MPELDYMILADYVRQDGSTVHIMAAGVDTVFAPVVPTVQPFGIALRLTFGAEEEVGASHYLKITFQSADGEQLLVARSVFNTPPPKPEVPEHWRTAMGLAIQIPVPLPRYGDYAFELDIDDGAITKSIDVRAVRPGQS
ncbi:MAG TPA: hypothetical protein VIJ82_21905 [Streptosporangiaceae bacterium]|jgi:hypothetical protein